VPKTKYSCKATSHITNNNGKKGKPNQKKNKQQKMNVLNTERLI
jgi:hypothetical protein